VPWGPWCSRSAELADGVLCWSINWTGCAGVQVARESRRIAVPKRYFAGSGCRSPDDCRSAGQYPPRCKRILQEVIDVAGHFNALRALRSSAEPRRIGNPHRSGIGAVAHRTPLASGRSIAIVMHGSSNPLHDTEIQFHRLHLRRRRKALQRPVRPLYARPAGRVAT